MIKNSKCSKIFVITVATAIQVQTDIEIDISTHVQSEIKFLIGREWRCSYIAT